MKATSLMGIEQIFTSYNNPKGNADTERVFRTLKEEIVWTREFKAYRSLKQPLTNGSPITTPAICNRH
jgi:transposase InsO family protein